jgi:hypothetical protein
MNVINNFIIRVVSVPVNQASNASGIP